MYGIVLLDDEPASLGRYARYIEGFGGDFSLVATGGDAGQGFAAVLKHDPALLISDIRMPGEDGLSLLERLRAAGWKGLAAIISGHDDFGYAQRSIRLGVFDFLLKPVFPEDMSRLLEEARRRLDEAPPTSLKSLPASREAAEPALDDLPEPLRRALRFIETRYDSRIALDDIAGAACVSSVWLGATFRRRFGYSIMAFVRNYRIGKARELLASTDLPIKRIAELLAFPDLPTFAKLFRKLEGVSPGAFRTSTRSGRPTRGGADS